MSNLCHRIFVAVLTCTCRGTAAQAVRHARRVLERARTLSSGPRALAPSESEHHPPSAHATAAAAGGRPAPSPRVRARAAPTTVPRALGSTPPAASGVRSTPSRGGDGFVFVQSRVVVVAQTNSAATEAPRRNGEISLNQPRTCQRRAGRIRQHHSRATTRARLERGVATMIEIEEGSAAQRARLPGNMQHPRCSLHV